LVTAGIATMGRGGGAANERRRRASFVKEGIIAY
jgi:hypothetical protein